LPSAESEVGHLLWATLTRWRFFWGGERGKRKEERGEKEGVGKVLLRGIMWRVWTESRNDPSPVVSLTLIAAAGWEIPGNLH
jgi:hypothetical protein